MKKLVSQDELNKEQHVGVFEDSKIILKVKSGDIYSISLKHVYYILSTLISYHNFQERCAWVCCVDWNNWNQTNILNKNSSLSLCICTK